MLPARKCALKATTLVIGKRSFVQCFLNQSLSSGLLFVVIDLLVRPKDDRKYHQSTRDVNKSFL